METITKFKAIDGKTFNSQSECLDYENLINTINNIMKKLPALPNDSIDFTNGDGFIQHDKNILRSVQVNLLEVIKKYIKHNWVQQTIDDENVHPSYVGRLIDDYGLNPLNDAWYRFMCIDKFGREWGQPFYANNPDKGKQVCIAKS